MKKQLKDVCEGFTKNIAQKDLSENNGKYPIFGASGIIKTIDFYISDKPYIGIVKDGSGVGRTNKYPAKSSLLGTMQYILPNQGIDLDYLMYGIRFLHLGENYSGAAIPHIYFKVYKNRTLDFPELAEQKHRSIVLNKIQDAINVKEKQLFELENIIQSEFVEMFGEIDISPQRNDWTELKDITTIYTGTTPSTTDEENWNGDILWITPAEMTSESFYIYDTERKITEKGQKSKNLSLMPANTVLLSTRAPIGKVGIAGSPMTCNQGFKNFYCKEDVLNPVYLYFLFKLNTEYLNSKGTGTTFKELSKSAAEKIKVPIPPLDLQNQFAAFVQKIDKSKFVVKQQITDLQELLDSKMQEYFS